MYDEERLEKRRLYVASFKDDIPNTEVGALIPRNILFSAPQGTMYKSVVWYMRPSILLAFSILLFAVSFGSTAYQTLTSDVSVAAPVAAPFDPEPFNYGLMYTYEEQSAERTYAELAEQKANFVEIDIEKQELRLIASGTVSTTLPIVYTPAADSWWYVPTGSYEITSREQDRYSTYANLYLPYSIHFGANYYIHGIPYYPDEERVPEGFVGGGVRLSEEDAQLLFATVATGTSVVVHGSTNKADPFIYETEAPNVTARQYLVADIKNNTVLVAHGLDDAAPIASLTKLMTALVAAEHIDLDRNVSITDDGDTFVTTLVPRLRAGNSASMYSLLQLLLVESSNEAGEVIADVLGRDVFLSLMNDTARKIGLQDTVFTDPSGLDSGNVSTVGDLFKLVEYIYDNRGFILELTRDQHLPTAYTNGQFGQLANFNFIEDVNFMAGKVGETEAAGQTSVSLHALQVQGQERPVAIIMLGSEARSSDVKSLVSFIEERYGD